MLQKSDKSAVYQHLKKLFFKAINHLLHLAKLKNT